MTTEVPQPNGSEQLKVVQMPAREDMLQRLQATGLYGLTPQTDAFYNRFIEQASDHEIVGQGLNMAWELASYDTLRQYPAVMRAVINAGFERVIDAVTPDAEVAEQAKEFRKKVLKEAERQRKAAEPKAEDLGPVDSLKDFDRYTQVRQIGNVLLEQDKGRHDDRTKDEVNPFYRQTHRGVFLEQYYGSPSILWTPWGEFDVLGSGFSWQQDEVDSTLQGLGATLHRPAVNNEMGTIGPIYAIHEVNGIALPEPVERPRSQFAQYEEVKAAWKSLTQQYRQSQGRQPRK